jgi:hypothetical protein
VSGFGKSFAASGLDTQPEGVPSPVDGQIW